MSPASPGQGPRGWAPPSPLLLLLPRASPFSWPLPRPRRPLVGAEGSEALTRARHSGDPPPTRLVLRRPSGASGSTRVPGVAPGLGRQEVVAHRQEPPPTCFEPKRASPSACLRSWARAPPRFQTPSWGGGLREPHNQPLGLRPRMREHRAGKASWQRRPWSRALKEEEESAAPIRGEGRAAGRRQVQSLCALKGAGCRDRAAAVRADAHTSESGGARAGVGGPWLFLLRGASVSQAAGGLGDPLGERVEPRLERRAAGTPWRL